MPSPRSWTVVMRLRSLSKGSSATRGRACCRSALTNPPRAAATSSAPSVGSPTTSCLPVALSTCNVASLHKALPARSKPRACGFPERSWFSGRPGVSTAPSVRSCSARSTCVPGTVTMVTVMRFSVRVPVLSEQMLVTDPRVSTAGNLRISALRLSMR